ncbi:ATP-binding protein [Actinomadura spongiicola]|uniref:ATP-binding protein n=1 Tax=Actinomadura spongiicola TaxID=2303421 RepID=A0A372GD21_9ACTN|nr:ATP-binding protein [Actinomadura spongiicola]
MAAETFADALADGAGAAPAAGTRPGWVWALPGGAGCAGHARRVLREALTKLGAPPGAIADAQIMVSELATNAHQHAGDHGPHELWLYIGGAETAEGTATCKGTEQEAGGDVGDVGGGEAVGGEGVGVEVRCAVFDTFADAPLPGYSWTSGDCGRGLSIVRELSGGRWGTRRTRSRLGPSVRGKAVWFAVPGATAAALR